MKIFSRILLLVVISALTVLSFQNCQKSKEVYSADLGTQTTPTPDEPIIDPIIPTEDIVVTYSTNSNYAGTATLFNFSETAYQRVEYIGEGGQGCQEILGVSDGYCNDNTHFVMLKTRPDWHWNSANKTFTSAMAAKQFHGRKVRNYYRKADRSGGKNYIIEAQSAAAASTSDVLVFFSDDAAGLTVRTEFPVANVFYAHVKNGNSTMKVCIYRDTDLQLVKNTTENHCTPANISDTSKWFALPVEESGIDGANDTMLTYRNPSNNYAAAATKDPHHTGKGNYIQYLYVGANDYRQSYFTIK